MIWTAVDKSSPRIGGKELRRVQGYMGKLLWLARTARPDLSHAATLLSSNVSVWDDVAERELCRLIGYLETYPDAVLGSVERSPERVGPAIQVVRGRKFAGTKIIFRLSSQHRGTGRVRDSSGLVQSQTEIGCVVVNDGRVSRDC